MKGVEVTLTLRAGLPKFADILNKIEAASWHLIGFSLYFSLSIKLLWQIRIEDFLVVRQVALPEWNLGSGSGALRKPQAFKVFRSLAFP